MRIVRYLGVLDVDVDHEHHQDDRHDAEYKDSQRVVALDQVVVVVVMLGILAESAEHGEIRSAQKDHEHDE